MSVHEGHRERLKTQFRLNGLDSLTDINALELLLFYAIPRRDTNEVAHALLERFGSLSSVFKASIPELCQVDGVGENTALLITLLPQMVRKYLVSDTETAPVLRTSRDAGKYLVPRFAFEQDEVALLLCLDSQRRVTGCHELARGVVNSVDVSVRKVVETALSQKASSVILSHNHPDSIALPSTADIMLTERLYKALNLVNIELADHIVVAGERFHSLRDAGIFMNFRGV